jgi:hypothetical protein
MEVLSVIGMLLAGSFGILKLAGSHFIKNIASKFAEIEADMKKQAVDLNLALDNKLNGMALTTKDKIEHESVKIRLANEERHSAYLEKFSTKDELLSMSAKHDKHMDDIFKLLRSIDNKVANSVTREEFNAAKDKS